MRKRLPVLALAALCGLALAILACSTSLNGRPTATPAGGWTPVPLDTANVPLVPTPTDAPLPTPEPAATAVIEDGPTPTPFRAAPDDGGNTIPAATAAPAGPKTVIVTEADVAQSIASGIVGQNGVQAQNLQVRFTGGKVRITADTLTYSFISVNDLVLVGYLIAQDGALQFETESISPGGLVTAMIPPLVNQALKNYGSQWYVEDVRTSEGQLELTVR